MKPKILEFLKSIEKRKLAEHHQEELTKRGMKKKPAEQGEEDEEFELPESELLDSLLERRAR